VGFTLALTMRRVCIRGIGRGRRWERLDPRSDRQGGEYATSKAAVILVPHGDQGHGQGEAKGEHAKQNLQRSRASRAAAASGHCRERTAQRMVPGSAQFHRLWPQPWRAGVEANHWQASPLGRQTA